MKKMILTVFALSLCPLAYASKRPNQLTPGNKAFERNVERLNQIETTSQKSVDTQVFVRKLKDRGIEEIGACKADCLANVAKYLSKEAKEELTNNLTLEKNQTEVIGEVFAKIPALATAISSSGISGAGLYVKAVGNAAVGSPRWVDPVAQGNMVRTVDRFTRDGALQKQANRDKLDEIQRRCKNLR